MAHGDISEVVAVDRESYPLPWPAGAYRRELNNRNARYIVLRELGDQAEDPAPPPLEGRKSWRTFLGWPRHAEQDGSRRSGRVIGYAGMWLVADEAHITTIAVTTARRGHGLGELLLATLIGMGYDLGIRWVTLEVRMSNEIAQRLYAKYGFHEAGVRKRYYSDNNEDALIMTTDDITLNAYQAEFKTWKANLMRRLNEPPSTVTVAGALSYRRA